MGRMTVPGSRHHVTGTRNAGNPHQYRLVPGVTGVPGQRARIHVHSLARLAHTSEYLPRVYTRNTRNTRNKPCAARLSAVTGTRNTKPEPVT